MNRPNIILLNTDQQSWDAISGVGNPDVLTPNIDRIRVGGISFSRAYCTNPLCAPARSSWATGLYTAETGVPFNDGHLHEDIPDIGELLSSQGYQTVHAGKWHVDGRDVRKSFTSLYFGQIEIEAGGAEYYDAATARAVVDFLTSKRAAEPFYLQIGFINPHDICEFEHAHEISDIPDPVRQGLLSPADLPPLPASFDFDYAETMVQAVFRRNQEALIHPLILRKTRDWTELKWRYLAWMYYRYVERVDVEIGYVLAALETADLGDTLIIFTSDHGEAAGRHHMFQKSMLYEETIRVPLTIGSIGDRTRIPTRGTVTDALVSGVDLFATICDFAEAPCPVSTHGVSLRPIVEGAQASVRDYVFVENSYWERSIVRDRFKLVTEYRPNPGSEEIPPCTQTHAFGRSQLFDLTYDPLETVNLIDDPVASSITAECRALLSEHEAGLHRRPLRPGRAQAIAREAGDALRRAWEAT